MSNSKFIKFMNHIHNNKAEVWDIFQKAYVDAKIDSSERVQHALEHKDIKLSGLKTEIDFIESYCGDTSRIFLENFNNILNDKITEDEAKKNISSIGYKVKFRNNSLRQEGWLSRCNESDYALLEDYGKKLVEGLNERFDRLVKGAKELDATIRIQDQKPSRVLA